MTFRLYKPCAEVYGACALEERADRSQWREPSKLETRHFACHAVGLHWNSRPAQPHCIQCKYSLRLGSPYELHVNHTGTKPHSCSIPMGFSVVRFHPIHFVNAILEQPCNLITWQFCICHLHFGCSYDFTDTHCRSQGQCDLNAVQGTPQIC